MELFERLAPRPSMPDFGSGVRSTDAAFTESEPLDLLRLCVGIASDQPVVVQSRGFLQDNKQLSQSEQVSVQRGRRCKRNAEMLLDSRQQEFEPRLLSTVDYRDSLKSISRAADVAPVRFNVSPERRGRLLSQSLP
eukprot:6198974-Pleurochrysis_carterae.AAC.3